MFEYTRIWALSLWLAHIRNPTQNWLKDVINDWHGGGGGWDEWWRKVILANETPPGCDDEGGKRARNIFFIWQNNFIATLINLIIIVITSLPYFQVVLQKPSLRPVSREARKEEEEVKEHHDDYDAFDLLLMKLWLNPNENRNESISDFYDAVLMLSSYFIVHSSL